LELNNDGVIYAGDLENGGMSVNSGDSGGPLVVSNADNSGFLLIGIASGVYPPAGMPQYPASYTAVAQHLEWIFNLADVNSDYGCMDQTACNYDAEVLYDHGFCYTTNECGNYEPEPLHGFDCYGECISGEKIHVEVEDIVSAYPAQFQLGNYEGIRGSYDVCLEDGCHAFIMNTFDENGIGTSEWFDAVITITNSEDEVLFSESLDESGTGLINFSLNTSELCTAGCTNPLAFNYEAAANADDGSCILPILCEEGTSYVLMMYDSWPYGTHINEVSISQSNQDGFTFLFAGELAEFSESFCLNDGCHIISVEGGWSNEISWELLDANQSIVLSGTGNEAMMFALNYEGECVPIMVVQIPQHSITTVRQMLQMEAGSILLQVVWI
jgi:hypothetical protein